MSVPPSPSASSPQRSDGMVRLRILSTTDIHMRLTGFDYVTDRPSLPTGLAGIGTLIAQARAEALAAGHPCVLLDNGDMFQGTPMATYLAEQSVGADHPAIASLNALAFDALGVGNHDLDFGLPYLRALAEHLEAPMVASNLIGDTLDPIERTAMIDVTVPGQDAPLRLGVLSVMPKQTEVWNQNALRGQAQISRAATFLQDAVPALRARGADLVVLLAHLGITPDAGPDPETALDLARDLQVDAIITGHTHRRFPGSDHRHSSDIDTAAGRLHDVPALMAGHGGSDLGVLDLDLASGADGQWKVQYHRSTLLPNTAETPALPAIKQATHAAHDALRKYLIAPLGWCDDPLHNYFSLAVPTSTCAMIAYAKMRLVRSHMQRTAGKDLPVIGSAAAHTAGGRDGPAHYLSISQGPILRRHLAGLDPYNNHTVAVQITGQELRNWLEHAALVFSELAPEGALCPLIRPSSPAFMFETVFGVRYTIDPTQPPGQRIGDLMWNGRAVDPVQEFILATNQFRAAGGGGFAQLNADQIVHRFQQSSEKTLADALNDPETLAQLHDKPWTFKTPMPVAAQIETSPQAADFLEDIAHLAPQLDGMTDTGFLKITLNL